MLLSACEYVLKDPPLTDIQPPSEAPPIQVSLNNSYDTVKVNWITEFSYVVTGRNKILSVNVVFEGKQIHNYVGDYGQTCSFKLDPSSYENGIHQLKIEIVTTSGSGSLADKLDAEGWMYTLEWPVIIDNTPPTPLNFVSIDSLGDGVRITWEKFRHMGFRYYKLSKTSTAFYGTVNLVTYYDPDQTSYVDTSYFEGMVVKYFLELGGTSSGLNSKATSTIQYSQVPYKPRITNVSDFSVDLSWDPPKKLNSLDYYYVHRSKSTVTIQDNERIFEPVRTQTAPVIFGMQNYFGLLYVPRPVNNSMYTGNLLKGELIFEPGQPMPSYHYACPIANSDNIMLSKGGKIYKYNLPDGVILDSVVTNSVYPDYFVLSPDGKIFGYSENGNFIARSTSDFGLLYTMSNPAFSDNMGIMLRLSLSDSGRLLMILDNNVFFIFDVTTSNIVASKIFSGLSWIVGAISPDGNNIITQEYTGALKIGYYQITADQIVNITILSGTNANFYQMIPHTFGPGNEIYVLYSNRIDVRNLSDFSLKRTLSYSGIQYIDFDNLYAVSGNIYDTGNLYSLNDGTMVRSLRVRGMTQMIYHHGYLVTPGRKMRIL